MNEKRSAESQKRHAESMIKIGENLHTSIIITVLVAPSIYLTQQLVESKIVGFAGIIVFIETNYAAIYFLLILLTMSAFLGSRFKSYGYDILDELNSNK